MTGIHGLFVFYGAGDMHGDPPGRAKLTYSMGATAAGVLIQSVEGTEQPAQRVALHCSELKTTDVDPWLFVFPTADEIAAMIAHAVACAKASGVWKLVLDLELFHEHDWTEAQIRQAVDGLRAAGFEVAITLYTRQHWDHIDWDVAAPGCIILLQAYEKANDPAELAMAVHRWNGRIVVVLFGTYLEGGPARVIHDMKNCAPWAQKFGAAGLWKLGSTSSAEASAIKDWVVATWAPPAK